MKKIITSVLLLLIIFLIITYYQEIVQYIMINVIYKDEVLIKDANEYEKDNNWDYVQTTENFTPNNKQDILNIFYTALNKGWSELTFYCPSSYNDCLDDVNDITSSQNTLSYINNFVSTYNSYNKIYVNMNTFGRVNIIINKIYDDNIINILNKKIDGIYNSIINDNMSDEDKIKAVHDYIIDNTVYDNERAEEIKSGNFGEGVHFSNTAFGPLITGKSICGGYTDAMALFLDKMNIPNFKIASKNHIWNVAYVNNTWKHIDLTWDDPVVNTGENIISYSYFLITTEELETKEDNQHYFDKKIFTEVR